jgi:hypothetical protein
VHKTILGSLLLLSSGWLPQVLAAKNTNKPQAITVALHDQAGVPRETLQEAERAATGIFEQAGIRLDWLDCTASPGKGSLEQRCRQAVYPQLLHLTVLSRSRGLSPGTMGISFLSPAGDGAYADIFFEPASEVPGVDERDLGLLLGHAAAHELGHLLLGNNSHAVQGLMRARWDNSELLQVRNGKLTFSESEAQQMQKRIAVRREMSSQTLGR